MGKHFSGFWMERIFVLSKNDNKVIEVAIKDDLLHFQKNLVNPGEFETLNVAMWLPERRSLKVMPAQKEALDIEDLSVTFTAQWWNEEFRQRIGAPRRECVAVGSATSKFVVCSSSAHEFFGNGIGAWQFAHLDIEFTDVHAESSDVLKGLLPELWGFMPTSERTKSFVVKEWTVELDGNHTEGHATVDKNLTRPLLMSSNNVVPV